MMKKILLLILSLLLVFSYGCKKDEGKDTTDKDVVQEDTTDNKEEQKETDKEDTDTTTDKEEKSDWELVVNDDRYAEEFTAKEHGDSVEEGKPSPDFTLKNIEGEEVKLDQFLESGELVLFNCFATTWPYCIEEMPDLVELDKRDDVKVVFVNMGQSPKLLKQFMKMNDLRLPVFFDDSKTVADTFLIRGIPTSILIDGDGVYKGTITGFMPLEDLEKVIDEKLGK